jgi:hypothetical protein
LTVTPLAGRHQDRVGLDFEGRCGPAILPLADEDAVRPAPSRGDPVHPGAQEDADAVRLERRLDQRGHVRVLAVQQLPAPIDQGHPRPQPRHRLGQLAADRPAPHDQEPAGRLLALEHRLVGQEPGLPEARNLGDRGAAAGGQHDVARPENGPADRDGVRGFEGGLPEEDVDAEPLEPLGRIVRGDPRPHVLQSPDDAAVIHRHAGGIERLKAGAAHPGGGARRGDERLARDAAVVQAVAPHQVALHEGDAPPQAGRSGRGHEARGAAPDDHDVVDPLAPARAPH